MPLSWRWWSVIKKEVMSVYYGYYYYSTYCHRASLVAYIKPIYMSVVYMLQGILCPQGYEWTLSLTSPNSYLMTSLRVDQYQTTNACNYIMFDNCATIQFS